MDVTVKKCHMIMSGNDKESSDIFGDTVFLGHVYSTAPPSYIRVRAVVWGTAANRQTYRHTERHTHIQTHRRA